MSLYFLFWINAASGKLIAHDNHQSPIVKLRPAFIHIPISATMGLLSVSGTPLIPL